MVSALSSRLDSLGGVDAEDLSEEDLQEAKSIALRVARLLGEELGQADEAVERLKELVAIAPQDKHILEVFDAFLRRENRAEDLRWLYAQREKVAEEASDIAAILNHWARFEESVNEDHSIALGIYARALEAEPENLEALDAQTRLALEAEDYRLAAKAVTVHAELLSGRERATKEALLARLYGEELEEPELALLAAKEALDNGAESGEVIAVLQRLVENPEVRGEAARLLSELYSADGDGRKEADALRALIAETTQGAEQLALFEKLASVYQESLEEPGGALGVILEALKIYPSELRLWDRGKLLAETAERPSEIAESYREAMKLELEPSLDLELSRRAADLHQTTLGDGEGAVVYLQKVLALEPEDEAAFERLKEILTSAERWRELEELYDNEVQRLDDDARRIEMLAEVALLAEDIIGNAESALAYHQRILELDSIHPVSLEALDRLYSRLERKEELLELLGRRVEVAVADELESLLVRAAQLAYELGQFEASLASTIRILQENSGSYDARDVAEKLLLQKNTRGEAATILEKVYEEKDEIRELVRVLGIRVEVLRPHDDEAFSEETVHHREDERRELLRRIATLRDDRLHDDEGSFDVFAELTPLDPVDTELRERLMESGRRLGRNERVVEVLKETAQAAEETSLTAEILLDAANIENTILEQSAAAESTWRQVLRMSDNEPECALRAAKELEQALSTANRYQELVQVLREQIPLEQDYDRKAALWARIAQLSAEFLQDPEGAIGAWEARWQDNPDDALALEQLSTLYAQVGRYEDLAQVLEQRRDAAVQDTERYALSRQLAEVQETKLDQHQRAIESYQVLLDEMGPTSDVLTALSRLYLAAQRWEDLADVLERQSDHTEDEELRLTALAELGRTRAQRLSDVPGALDAWRRALSFNSAHEASREALKELLQHEDSIARLEAAEVLQPIFEADANHEELLGVLEVQASASDDPGFKAERFELAMHIAEDELQNSGRALDFAVRGIIEASASGEIQDWLGALERLAEASDGRQKQVDALEQAVDELFDSDLQLRVISRVAEIKAEELQDRKGAIAAYEKALEFSGDDRDVLSSVAELYRAESAWEELLSALQKLEDIAESELERKEVAYRKAELLALTMKQVDAAIEAYESIVDIALEEKALLGLEALYGEAERYDDLASLIQRQIDEEVSDVPNLRVKLARVQAFSLLDIERAIDEVEQALQEDTQHELSVALLEELRGRVEEAYLRGRIAALLEPVYMARADYDKVLSALELRLSSIDSPDEKKELVARIAQLHEEQREDYLAALEITATLLDDDLHDSSVNGELERLAGVASAELRLAEILAERLLPLDDDDEVTAALCRRAGTIFVEQERKKEALPLLQRALQFEPESAELFDAVDQLLIAIGTPEQRVALYRDGLDHRYDPDEQLRMQQVIAFIEEKQLGNVAGAVAAHLAALEADGTNDDSFTALARLYRAAESWAELAELYENRAQALPPFDAAPYRLELAELLEEKLEQPEAALEQLEDLVRDVPDNGEAIAKIESFRAHEDLRARVVDILRPLFEANDDWRKLIALNEDRYLLANDDADKVVVLRETAELWENRGDDLGRARRALSNAFRLEPDSSDLRLDIERMVVVTEEWAELAALYEDVLGEHDDLAEKRELVSRLAELKDEKLDDPRGALGRYTELHALEPSELEPLFAMVRLATLLGDWSALEFALVAQAEVSYDDFERVRVYRRLGLLRLRTLENRDGAVAAFESAFEANEQDPEVTDQLIDLYEESNDAERLVDLYAARIAGGDLTEEERFDLSLKSAARFETDLKDLPRAIEALNEALLSRPDDASVLNELRRLFTEEELWSELLENLRLQAGLAEDAAQRLELRRQVASVLAEKMESYEEALEALGTILDEYPDDSPAIDAVFGLVEGEDHLKLQAADLLVPALRQVELPKRLVAAYRLRLDAEQDPVIRLETLRAMAEVQESDLQDNQAAFDSLALALSESTEPSDLGDELKRLGASLENWSALAQTFETKAADVYEPEFAQQLWVDAGRLREEKLKDYPQAIEDYRAATEQVGDHLELLDALDRLSTLVGDTAAVVELLERRMPLAETDVDRAKLYTRQGQLQLEEQAEPAEALVSLRQALELDPSNEEASSFLKKILELDGHFDESFDILDGVYRQRSSGAELAELHQLRVARASNPEDRVEMRRVLAQVLEEECQDALAAQKCLQEAVAELPSDSGLQDELERILPITEQWSLAAEALLNAVKAAEEIAEEDARSLGLRAAEWQRDRAGDRAGAERAFAVALNFAKKLEDNYSQDEILQQMEALQSDEGREADLLKTLCARVEVIDEVGVQLELLQRAQEIALGLGQADRAEEIIRQALELEPEEEWALFSLFRLRKEAGDSEETYQLLLQLQEMSHDVDRQRELKIEAAGLAVGPLEKLEEGIEILEELYAEEPSAAISDYLRQAYVKAEDWTKLSELLDRLVQSADSEEERATYLVERAELLLQRFEQASEASELLESIVSVDPVHGQALALLNSIYEDEKNYDALGQLLEGQIKVALDKGATEDALELLESLGSLKKEKAGDLVGAISVGQRLIELSRTLENQEKLLALYLEAEDRQSAARLLEEIVEDLEDEAAVPRLLELAELYKEQEDLDGALRSLERGLAASGDDAELRERLREEYLKAERYEPVVDMILADAEATNEVADKVAIYREAAALIQSKLGDALRVAETLGKAAELAPDDRELLLELCDAYSASNRGDEAVSVLEQIVSTYAGKRSKELGEIHRRLATAYLSQENMERALQELDRAFRIEPGNIRVLKQLGEVAMQTGDMKKAQQMFRALLLQKLDANAPISKALVFLRLGQISQQLGEGAKAKQMYERALQQDAELEEARAGLASL
ncbi:MAG: tetratricopeptide repeat protein [Polyangiaceae bacterium]|nr:tetratricopeptide repeat protein [Polyangiaceae bacterium]